MYSVYIHTFPNDKKYIGITSWKPELRWGANGANYKNPYMVNAIKKYGWSRKRDSYYKKINADYEWCIILALSILTPIYLLFYIILFYIIKNVPLYNIYIKRIYKNFKKSIDKYKNILYNNRQKDK